jgi:dihydroorotate dehydrogenase (NAD+) catalytic subunit
MIDTKVTICGVTFENPIITASGTFGFGEEFDEYAPLSEYGGICVKGLKLLPTPGNPPPRIAETPAGILNSVGLQNPGVEAFLEKDLPRLRTFDTKLIVNIAGNTIDEYCQMAARLADADGIAMLELNISCPNVKEGGVAFGTNAATVNEITRRVKKEARQPLVVKLSPNVTDITEMARAAEDGGADAISLINTLLGMAIDVHSRRPILKNNMGGLSGPAVKPVAVRMVYQVANAVSLPVIGMGGVMSGEDVAEFLLAGASVVALGTGMFQKPDLILDVKQELLDYMRTHQVEHVTDLIGKVELN